MPVGYIRIIQPSLQMILNRVGDVNLCSPTKLVHYGQDWVYTQRACSLPVLQWLNKARSVGMKVCVDYDDILWLYKGQSLPNYNFSKVNYKQNTIDMAKYLNESVDKISVTTETLRDSLLQFVPSNKIEIIPNMLTRSIWHYPRDLDGKNLPLSFLYAGSATHFDNVNKIYGDWTVEWDNYLKDKNISIQGICPWFIKANNVYPWVNMNEYVINFYNNSRNTKFILAPLADNIFNKCKSDLKYLECAAVGRVALVTDFPNSPYQNAHPLQKIPVNATSKQISNIVKMCEDNYDEILEYQYKYLNNRWLENNIGKYQALFENKVNI